MYRGPGPARRCGPVSVARPSPRAVGQTRGRSPRTLFIFGFKREHPRLFLFPRPASPPSPVPSPPTPRLPPPRCLLASHPVSTEAPAKQEKWGKEEKERLNRGRS